MTQTRVDTTGQVQGLTATEVADRVSRGQVNDVPVRSSRSTAEIVRANVFTLFNGIIGTLFAIILVVGPIQDGLFGFVIIANALIGIVQELRAKRTLDNLAVIGEARPVVRRDGEARPIPTDSIVLDDVIELSSGAKVVVDGVVNEADGLEVDESLLTGEADPVVKRPGDPVMSGSFVVAGSGAFTATRVGREAYAVQLAEEASRFTLVHSELRSGISRILKFCVLLMIPAAIGLIISQLLVEGADTFEAIRRMVAGIVVMVPEGLVLLTSMAFAIGVIRLGRQQCLVQELPAIEGLARVSVVCLDKTGTLTEGGMDVREVRPLPGGALPPSRHGAGTTPASMSSGDPVPDATGSKRGSGRAPVAASSRAGGGVVGAVRNSTDPHDSTDPANPETPPSPSPSPTPATERESGSAPPPEIGATRHASDGTKAHSVIDSGHLRDVLGALGAGDRHPNASLRAIAEAHPAPEGWRAVATLPFSSARKYSGAALVEPDGTHRTWLLGAPDVLLPPGHPVLTEADRLNSRGLRVLLLTRADLPADRLASLTEAGDGPAGAASVPTALVVLEQRLRPEAADTLRYFAEQDIEAKVISGDNAVSVGAVAAELDLPGADRPVDARSLSGDPARMAGELEKGTVYGRVTPQQKREMVAALQSRGHDVAMTGDGVNDVLALKDADIGVAMGSGSEATRAVAQIVLLNNSFATLPSVVAEGRRVIGNIERVANLFLTKTVYSVFMAFAVIISQVPYPFLPRHLTLISALTIGLPAFFLALAPNRERARPHFVRRVLRFSVPFGLITGVSTFSVYLLARSYYGATEATLEAETSAASLTLFLVALGVLSIIARPYTWWRVGLLALMACGFLTVLATPWLQEFFALSLVGMTMPWVAVVVAGIAVLGLEVVWRIIPRYWPDLPEEPHGAAVSVEPGRVGRRASRNGADRPHAGG